MAIETSLSKVNIFSTKALYDENFASLGEDEISFIPVDEVVSTGFILPFAGFSVPEGWLPCNGAEVSRSTYAKLFAVIGTTYGAGNGSTTFNLPNLTDKFIQGSDTAGTVVEAGLPNITGGFDGNTDDGNSNKTGAFYALNTKNSGANGGEGPGVVGFDASRSNPIYGNSDTVQPPALTMRYIIKY